MTNIKPTLRLSLSYLLVSSAIESVEANVKSWAALGDSYASGIGAGVRRTQAGDTVCSRYTEGYPEVVNVVLDGTAPSNRAFNWVACSGAKTDYVKSTEVPKIASDIDMATLTIGGNDIGFFDILNYCIFQFTSGTTCDDQLQDSSNQIQNDLPAKLDSTILAILNQADKPGFRLYMTGYAGFWNNETTQCNDVSFNFWETKPSDRANLTQELRTTMNTMLSTLNNQISAAVARANDHDLRSPVVFVDYSPSFAGHRYCDEGIPEPDPTGSNPQRWFQENWLFKPHAPYVFSGDAIATMYQSWAQTALDTDPSLQIAGLSGNGTVDVSGSTEWIFDGLARAFHPTVDGHDGIRLEVLSAYSAKPPTVQTATTSAPSSSSSSSASSAASGSATTMTTTATSAPLSSSLSSSSASSAAASGSAPTTTATLTTGSAPLAQRDRHVSSRDAR
ncbi:MAG: hypothetical protein HETSPECPRED_003979 [Heterodermia speciosa]|uniref:SGNH hydrolase-type esterase domain-containing protein n=1 Tax=Heterodermia speciosa TaxID=116794 RepID=A0A8H3F621_9LECA|nr:MAG: hypothetical protein HETSPECPRED_003979 [Heterodermia speciosa]